MAAGAAVELPVQPAGEAGAVMHRLPTATDTGGGAVALGSAAADPLAAVAANGVNHDVNAQPGNHGNAVVAIAPGDPTRVIAAVNSAGGLFDGVWISTSSMTAGTQVRRSLPALSSIPAEPASTLAPCCDPTLAADSAGNLWVGAVALEVGGTQANPCPAPAIVESRCHVIVNRVAPGSTLLLPTNVALPKRPGTLLQDQPAIAVDDGSPAKDGRIYAAWVENDGADQALVLSECDGSADVADCDDPGAWSEPAPITDPPGFYARPDLAVAPNGDLHVAWWDPGPDNAIELDSCLAASADCADAGEWGGDGTVRELDAMDDDGVGGADPLPFLCPIIGAPGGRVGPGPDIEVGPGGEVHVAFGDLRDNADPGVPTRCTASGTDKTWEGYVVTGDPAGSAPTSAEAPVRLSDDGASDLNDHFLPALSADPTSGEVEVSLYSTKHDPSGQSTHQYYVASGDAGQAFGPMTRISTASSRFSGSLSDGYDYGDYHRADSAQGTFVPAWSDNRLLQGRQGDLYVLSPQAETEIVSGPLGTVADPIQELRFSSGAPGLQCRVDGGEFEGCDSPHTVGPLANGIHVFEVRAADAVGNAADLSPASRTWRTNDLTPPNTTITGRPPGRDGSKRAEHEFAASEEASTFECRYDRKRWRSCESPSVRPVRPGRHRFRVRAVDLGGNADPTPAKDRWKRKGRR